MRKLLVCVLRDTGVYVPSQPSVNPITFGLALVLDPPEGVEIAFPEDRAREVLAMVFNDPVHTQVGMSPTGFVASVPGNPPKIAELGLKLSARTSVPGETAGALVKLYSLVCDAVPTIQSRAYGFNFEFEFSFPGILDSGKWIAEHFLAGKLTLPERWKIDRADFNFSIEGPELLRRNIQLQPRKGRPHYFFASVNNHYACAPSSPKDASQWTSDLNTTYDSTRRFVLELLDKHSRTKKKRQ